MNIKKTILIAAMLCSFTSAQSTSNGVSLYLKNPSSVKRSGELIRISLDSLQHFYPSFNFESAILIRGNDTLLSEIITNEPLGKKELAAVINLLPNEAAKINFVQSGHKPALKKYTQAYLGGKKEFIKKDGYYTGGHFEKIDLVKVPVDHFAHDALYQFEGPGWESGNVGYRIYLDDRNRTDIFGKKKTEMVLDEVGRNDLISDGKESYQSMLNWGQDIFKVGNSLGIGTPAIFNDSVITISNADSVISSVFNNDLLSGVNIKHYGWNTGAAKMDIAVTYTIPAFSRLTHVVINADASKENFCTGIAKHEGTEFIKSDGKGDWNYIALWGKQTLINDNLGIAVIYRNSDLKQVTEDKLSYIIVLNSGIHSPDYYFSAAWEQEENGIKTKEQFNKYLDDEIEKLNNPIEIKIL